MSQCSRCNKPLSAGVLFCDACRLQQDRLEHGYSDVAMVPYKATSLQERKREAGTEVVATTTVVTAATTAPLTPVKLPKTPPPSANDAYINGVELALQKLNDAARRIALVEHGQRRVPHASRLFPLRDLTPDIHRLSTPLREDSGKLEYKQNEDLDRKMPDLWPWHDADIDENDSWANRTDPLLSRRIPNTTEAARIEEEDMRRAIAEGLMVPSVIKVRPRTNRIRVAFICLSLLAILALAVDGVLILVTFSHTHRQAVLNGPPTLTLSTNVASYGQTVTLHIRRFWPNTGVYLTHDIHVPLRTSNATSLIHVNGAGSADVSMLIDYNDWDSGFHTIEAEDVKTRYSANATLQIAAGRSTPPHLILKSDQLDFGSAIVGASTIRPFMLSNAGNGAITWAASSNQPWLVLTPAQGSFSNAQTITIGVERVNLRPAHYKGTITFSSNVGAPERLEVEMGVSALPPNAGPVLSVTPAVLSFSALDGGADPDPQVLVVSNPGSHPLSWSLASNTPATPASQNAFLQSSDMSSNWISLDHTAGVVEPGATNIINVAVHSRSLLPGTYLNTLVFSPGHGTLDGAQEVSISLTVQPGCGLTLSSGSISFTAVVGQGNPSTQVLNIGATSSCNNEVAWHSLSSASWLTITPASDQLKSAASMATTIGVNTAGLNPGTYVANLSIVTQQNTQWVPVTLVLQAPPPPNAPVMGVSTLNLNFSTTQGQPDPPGQQVTITNTGGGTLQWHTQVNMLATTWLHAGPTGGAIAPRQTGQLTVFVSTSGLTPGTYVGQVVLFGLDQNNASASGSPQTITINLLVLPPCSLAQPSASQLSFDALQNGTDPVGQSVLITASGNCGWPVSWKTSVTSAAPWLNMSPITGTFNASGQSATVNVNPSVVGLAPGTYSTQVMVTALDSSGVQPQGSPQVFTVTFTVQQPCALHVLPSMLSFTVAQGQISSAQKSGWYETGTCAMPLSWSVTHDSGSAGWLLLGATSGTVSGSSASTQVSVNAASLTPGNYSGFLTISVSGNGGVVQGSPQTVRVNLKVTNFTIAGVVDACTVSGCPAPVPLPGATVTLTNGSGQTDQTVTAGTTGKFNLPNVPVGSYTVLVSGTDGAGVQYAGSVSITVSGSQSNLAVQALPG